MRSNKSFSLKVDSWTLGILWWRQRCSLSIQKIQRLIVTSSGFKTCLIYFFTKLLAQASFSKKNQMIYFYTLLNPFTRNGPIKGLDMLGYQLSYLQTVRMYNLMIKSSKRKWTLLKRKQLNHLSSWLLTYQQNVMYEDKRAIHFHPIMMWQVSKSIMIPWGKLQL